MQLHINIKDIYSGLPGTLFPQIEPLQPAIYARKRGP
jgi:hypothetical protein